MKSTIYGNRLLRGTQVKRGWEPLIYANQKWPFTKKITTNAKNAPKHACHCQYWVIWIKSTELYPPPHDAVTRQGWINFPEN